MLAPTANTGAQVIILGHNHLSKVRTSFLAPHNSSPGLLERLSYRAMCAFYRCVRVKSALTGNTLVLRGMVYMIEGDIFPLSHTALQDLGVLPTTFPRIGELGGIEQQ